MTPRVRSSGARSTDAWGNSSNEKRSSPYAPILMMTPARTTDPAVGASVCTSGSQVWNGTNGTLIAKAARKPRNSSVSVVPERPCQLHAASTR